MAPTTQGWVSSSPFRLWPMARSISEPRTIPWARRILRGNWMSTGSGDRTAAGGRALLALQRFQLAAEVLHDEGAADVASFFIDITVGQQLIFPVGVLPNHVRIAFP